MEREQIYKIGLDMTYLASCALHNSVPDRSRVESMQLVYVFKMAKKHSLSAITYLAVEAAVKAYSELDVDNELLSAWKKDYHIQVQRLVKFDLEREALCSFLREQEIWYLPLKGVILQNYYPTLGMRQMSDNDILVEPQKCKLIKKHLTARGYEVISYGKGCHDIYGKSGIYFEIHRKLAHDLERMRTASRYYEKVKDRLISVDGGCEYKFTDEDFYVYFIFHSNKHYKNAGFGVRTLMDISAYLSKKEDSLDFKYIDSELHKLELTQFETNTKELAKALFSTNPERIYSADFLDESKSEMFLFCVSSGTYGTLKNQMDLTMERLSGEGKINRKARLKYILGRAFPKMEFYKENYPIAYKLIIPIPFVCCWRLIKSIFKYKAVREELKYVKNIK